MKGFGLNHVAPVFRVVDLDRSISYYRKHLGFELEFEHAGFYAGLVRDGCHVHLKRGAPLQCDRAALTAEEHVDACFMVQDAAHLAVQFATAGASLAVPLRTMPYGQEFYVNDPDGYVLAFVQATH